MSTKENGRHKRATVSCNCNYALRFPTICVFLIHANHPKEDRYRVRARIEHEHPWYRRAENYPWSRRSREADYRNHEDQERILVEFAPERKYRDHIYDACARSRDHPKLHL